MMKDLASILADVSRETFVGSRDIKSRSVAPHIVAARHLAWRRMIDAGYPPISAAKATEHTVFAVYQFLAPDERRQWVLEGSDFREAVRAWRAGFSTNGIASILGCRESAVYNALTRWRESHRTEAA